MKLSKTVDRNWQAKQNLDLDTLLDTDSDMSVRTGKFDRMADAFPERIEFRAKVGVNELLQQEAKNRGFGSVSKLIRASLKFALSHEDFKGGEL